MPAKAIEESSFDELLRTRYPLTYYLSRQQNFAKIYHNIPTLAPPNISSETTAVVTQKQKTPLPPPPCFNVPDTLDFNASSYEQNDEMEQSSEMEEIVTQTYDETILSKNNHTRINESVCDVAIKFNASLIQRTSAIQLEFSPFESSSPLRQAIENGLSIINK